MLKAIDQSSPRRLYGRAVEWDVLLKGADELVELFSKAPQWGDVGMAMGQMEFGPGASCCHACWYLREGWADMDLPRKYRGKVDFDDDFEHGAYSMACLLGFKWKRLPSVAKGKTPADLMEDFFEQNADLWGNEHGKMLFYELEAFGKRTSTTERAGEELKVWELAEHWKGVRERIAEAMKS